jgi:hypothetical protein
MNCPHCGAPVLSGNVFCHRCRKRISPPGTTPSPEPLPTTPISRPAVPPPLPRTPASRPVSPEPLSYGAPPAAFRRPTVVTILAALDIMGGLIALGGAVLVLVAGATLSSGSRGEAPPSVLLRWRWSRRTARSASGW